MRNKAQSNVSHSVKSVRYKGGHMGVIQRNDNILRSRLAFDLHLALQADCGSSFPSARSAKSPSDMVIIMLCRLSLPKTKG